MKWEKKVKEHRQQGQDSQKHQKHHKKEKSNNSKKYRDQEFEDEAEIDFHNLDMDEKEEILK